MVARANRNTKHCVTGQGVCWTAYFYMFACLRYVLHILRESVCVCVAVGIQGVMRKRIIVTCGLSGSYNIFPRYLTKDTLSVKSY